MATKTNIKEVAEVPTLAELYQSYKQREEDVYASNVARQQEIENILATQLGMYQPGGAFEQASLAELAKTKVRDVSATAQSDISRGLYGIRPYEQEWESNVGAPARLRLEDILQQRRSAVLSARAGFLENIQEPYPDTSGLTEAIIANAQTGGEATGGTGGKLGGGGELSTTYGRSYGASSFPDMFSIGGSTPGGRGVTASGLGGGPKSLEEAKAAAKATYERLGEAAKTQTAGTFTPEQLTAATTPTSTVAANQAAVDIMKLPTFEQYKTAAIAKGLNPGTEEEWVAVRRRLGY